LIPKFTSEAVPIAGDVGRTPGIRLPFDAVYWMAAALPGVVLASVRRPICSI
jgi:hypothetical protein